MSTPNPPEEPALSPDDWRIQLIERIKADVNGRDDRDFRDYADDLKRFDKTPGMMKDIIRDLITDHFALYQEFSRFTPEHKIRAADQAVAQTLEWAIAVLPASDGYDLLRTGTKELNTQLSLPPLLSILVDDIAQSERQRLLAASSHFSVPTLSEWDQTRKPVSERSFPGIDKPNYRAADTSADSYSVWKGKAGTRRERHGLTMSRSLVTGDGSPSKAVVLAYAAPPSAGADDHDRRIAMDALAREAVGADAVVELEGAYGRGRVRALMTAAQRLREVVPETELVFVVRSDFSAQQAKRAFKKARLGAVTAVVDNGFERATDQVLSKLAHGRWREHQERTNQPEVRHFGEVLPPPPVRLARPARQKKTQPWQGRTKAEEPNSLVREARSAFNPRSWIPKGLR